MNRFICDSFYRTLDRSFEMRHSHSNHRSNAQVNELAAGWVMRRASGQLDLHFKGTGVDLSGGCRAGDMAQIQHLWARDVPAEAQTHGRSWKNTDYFDEQMLHKQVLSSWVTFQMFWTNAGSPSQTPGSEKQNPFSSTAYLHILLEKFSRRNEHPFSGMKHLCLNSKCTISGRLSLISQNNTSIDSPAQSIPVEHS